MGDIQPNKGEVSGEKFVLLLEELDILSKLVYRNRNQHGKVKAFSYINRAIKHVYMIEPNAVETLLTTIAGDLSKFITKSYKIDSTINANLLTSYQNSCKVFELYLQVRICM